MAVANAETLGAARLLRSVGFYDKDLVAFHVHEDAFQARVLPVDAHLEDGCARFLPETEVSREFTL